MFKIEQELGEIKKPKIPFTNIPNPIGAGKLIRSNGVDSYIPLYYLQAFILKVRWACKRKYYKCKRKRTLMRQI